MTVETVYAKRCPRCDDLTCSKSAYIQRCNTCGYDLELIEPEVLYIARQDKSLLDPKEEEEDKDLDEIPLPF